MQTGLRLWQRNSDLDRVYASEVVIKAIDAQTKEAVPVKLKTYGRGLNQRWPDYSISVTDDPSELRIGWIDVGPLHVVVSSPGYSEQPLSLNRESERRLVIPLSTVAVAEAGTAPDRAGR